MNMGIFICITGYCKSWFLQIRLRGTLESRTHAPFSQIFLALLLPRVAQFVCIVVICQKNLVAHRQHATFRLLCVGCCLGGGWVGFPTRKGVVRCQVVDLPTRQIKPGDVAFQK
jgi:hypothetical protein